MTMTKTSPDIVRQFFLEEHPNPERIGCPPEETLQAAAENRLPVTDPARLHMAKCSECFAEYRGYRIDWEAKQAANRRILGWAVAAAVLVGVVGGTYAFRHHGSGKTAPQEIAVNTPPNTVVEPPKQNPPSPADPNGKDPHRPIRIEPHPPSQRNPPSDTPSPEPVTNSDELRSATLNLSGKPLPSEPDRAGKILYSLPAANLKLRIVLPRNAQEGSYIVRLSNDIDGAEEIASAEGKALRKDTTLSLDVKLLLRGKKTGSRYLLVGPKGSDKPDIYDLRLVSEQNSIPPQ